MAESVKSADRVLDLLVLLADNPEGLTFTEIVAKLGWPRSSTHGLINTLTTRSFLSLDAQRRTYSVGVRAWEVGRAFLGGEDLGAAALPEMKVLSLDLNETVQLAVLDGRENIYVAKVDSSHPLALVSRVGARIPAHVTGVGKVLLSALPEDQLRELFADAELPAYTEQSITDMQTLMTVLAAVRQDGFATDSGEFTPGVFCVAGPVHDRTGVVVAALSVTVPDVRVDDEMVRRMKAGVAHAGTVISTRLGHT